VVGDADGVVVVGAEDVAAVAAAARARVTAERRCSSFSAAAGRPSTSSAYRRDSAAPVSALDVLAIFLAGIAAGTNQHGGRQRTLITFPVLLGLGYAPVVANVSNTVGLVPGSASGAFGYRLELTSQGERLVRSHWPHWPGGLTGAVLLQPFLPRPSRPSCRCSSLWR